MVLLKKRERKKKELWYCYNNTIVTAVVARVEGLDVNLPEQRKELKFQNQADLG